MPESEPTSSRGPRTSPAPESPRCLLGHVEDGHGNPVAGAHVVAFAPDEGDAVPPILASGTRADAGGRFRLEVPPVPLLVLATAPGGLGMPSPEEAVARGVPVNPDFDGHLVVTAGRGGLFGAAVRDDVLNRPLAPEAHDRNVAAAARAVRTGWMLGFIGTLPMAASVLLAARSEWLHEGTVRDALLKASTVLACVVLGVLWLRALRKARA